ncbi:MAG: alpha/beta hydrolase [Victivallaceae bacterium]|nr:alpha/beta hydrolase [Victivallaceae bacterium]
MAFKIISYGAILALTVFGFGCASDYGVTKSNKTEWLETYARSPLTNDGLSFRVKNYLTRENYLEEYQNQPTALLKKLDSKFKQSGDNLTLFALTELAYDQGSKRVGLNALSYYLSCAIYASTYLRMPRTNPYSAYFIVACRYYNYASAEIIKLIKQEKIPLNSKWDLPVIQGKIVVNPAKSELPLPLKDYVEFLSCYDFIQFGFQSYSRSSGLGVPLIALQYKKTNLNKEISKTGKGLFKLSGLPSAATLFIRIKKSRDNDSTYLATPEFHDPYLQDYLMINNERAAMEIDLTTPLAYMANSGATYSGFSALRNFSNMKLPEGLYLLTPYSKNKIPVVFVHGLMSSPRTWMQLTNSLLGNKAIREKYQFFFFAYPTGLPVLYSAKKLRNALLEAQREFDPQHNNPYFNRMVVIGHSMGGLLTKTLVIDPGRDLEKKLFNAPIEAMDLSNEQKKFLTDILCFKPLPFVSEVVFMATPHRGAAMVEWGITQWANSFITLPSKFVDKIKEMNHKALIRVGVIDDDDLLAKLTGVNSLDPNNKALAVMNQKTIIVPFHLVIGDQKKAGKVGGSDGVVDYSSSHLDGTASELVIKSGHNVQTMPEGIKEIRQILLNHLKSN